MHAPDGNFEIFHFFLHYRLKFDFSKDASRRLRRGHPTMEGNSVDNTFRGSRIDRQGGSSHPAVAFVASAMIRHFFDTPNTFLGR